MPKPFEGSKFQAPPYLRELTILSRAVIDATATLGTVRDLRRYEVRSDYRQASWVLRNEPRGSFTKVVLTDRPHVIAIEHTQRYQRPLVSQFNKLWQQTTLTACVRETESELNIYNLHLGGGKTISLDDVENVSEIDALTSRLRTFFIERAEVMLRPTLSDLMQEQLDWPDSSPE